MTTEERKQYQKCWNRDNPRDRRAEKAAYHQAKINHPDYASKQEALKRTVNYRLNQTYNSMCRRVEGKRTNNPHLYIGKSICGQEEFKDWPRNDIEFNRRFEAWIESGCQYKLSPSIDRIDSDKGYDIGNMQWLTVSENGAKAKNKK